MNPEDPKVESYCKCGRYSVVPESHLKGNAKGKRHKCEACGARDSLCNREGWDALRAKVKEAK